MFNLQYLTSHTIDLERTRWRLFLKHVMRTTLDIYVFITSISAIFMPKHVNNTYVHVCKIWRFLLYIINNISTFLLVGPGGSMG